MGDFKADVLDPSMTSFCTLFKLKKHCEGTDMLQEPTKSQLHRFILNYLTIIAREVFITDVCTKQTSK